MTQPSTIRSLSAFLDWEEAQEQRHEYCGGLIWRQGDVRRVHALVAGNLSVALKAHLKGSRCRAFGISLNLQVGNEAMLYPDVFVTCDPQDLKTDMVFRSPKLIVEVLSDSTQAYDRGLKFAAYRQLASL